MSQQPRRLQRNGRTLPKIKLEPISKMSFGLPPLAGLVPRRDLEPKSYF
jgi:hypothetical protein